MIPRLLIIIAMTMLLVCLPLTAEGRISLGSAQDAKHATIIQGGEASFRLLFFNVHEEGDIDVYAGVYDNGGLSVDIEPDRISVPYTRPGRYTENEPGFVYLGTPEGDVKAKPVTVRVSVPLSAEPGRHEVVLYAATERQEGIMGTSQTRRFFFEVDVREADSKEAERTLETVTEDSVNEEHKYKQEPEPENETRKKNGINDAASDDSDSITGAVTNVPLFGPALLAGIVLMFVILRLLKRI